MGKVIACIVNIFLSNTIKLDSLLQEAMPVSRGGPPPTTLPQAPTRSGWLGFMPVSALEDNIRSMSLEAREAREFDEDKGTMMCSFEDLPLVFSCQKHRHENTSIDLIMQTWRMRDNDNSFGGSLYLSKR